MQIAEETGRAEAFRAGEWLCEPRLHRITGRGKTSQVEPKVMQVLVCLALRSGRVVTRRELLESVWADTAVSEQVLSRAISELRKVFEDDSRTPRVIETIAKSGYRLIVPVERVGDDASPPSAGDPRAGLAAVDRNRHRASRWRWLAAGLLVGAALTLSGLGLWVRVPTPEGRSPMSLAVLLPAEAPPELAFFRSFALSPDGRWLVYTANLQGSRQLYVRHLDRAEAEAIPGTRGGYGPFFSRDSRQIGFYAGGRLKRVPVDGGDPVTASAVVGPAARWLSTGGTPSSRRC